MPMTSTRRPTRQDFEDGRAVGRIPGSKSAGIPSQAPQFVQPQVTYGRPTGSFGPVPQPPMQPVPPVPAPQPSIMQTPVAAPAVQAQIAEPQRQIGDMMGSFPQENMRQDPYAMQYGQPQTQQFMAMNYQNQMRRSPFGMSMQQPYQQQYIQPMARMPANSLAALMAMMSARRPF
jgi:hypothetical protein